MESPAAVGESTALVPTVVGTGGLPALREADLVPQLVSDWKSAKSRLVDLQEFIKEVMVEGEDYGTLPGMDRKILFKSGAEKLAEIYGYALHAVVVARIEDWEKGFFHYEVRTDVVSKRTGFVVGTGLGSCNSRESRYRWRNAQRECPECKNTSIIKGSEEYGGGYVCWKKKGGCGAKFKDGDARIEDQVVGKIENPEPFDLVNTILKMSKKRSGVDGVITVTRSSALFTQDEELIEGADDRKDRSKREEKRDDGARRDDRGSQRDDRGRGGNDRGAARDDRGGQRDGQRSAPPPPSGPPPGHPAASAPPAGSTTAPPAAAAAASSAPAQAAPASAPAAASAAPAPEPAPPPPPADALACTCPCGCTTTLSQRNHDFSKQALGAPRCPVCYPAADFNYEQHKHLESLGLPAYAGGYTPDKARAVAERARAAL